MRLTTLTTLLLPALISATSLSPTLSPSPSPTTPPPHLEIRQGAPVVAPVAGASPGAQVPPVTTVQVGAIVDGVYKQVLEVYTQLFTTPLDPWPTASAGAIGLGTLSGEVKVTNSKREVMETQLPVVVSVQGVPEVEEEVVEVKKEGKTVEENAMAKLQTGAGSALAMVLAIAVMIVV